MLIRAVVFIVASGAVLTARAQDFDDQLESELDSLSSGLSSGVSPSPSPAPAAKTNGKTNGKTNAAPSASAPPANGDASPDELDIDSETENQIVDEPLEDPFRNEQQAKTPEPKPAPMVPSKVDKQASLAPATDEPNSSFEARLSRIYSEHSEPVSDEKWSGLLGSRASESYSVQTGDTLWDLSQTLFADGFYWSKLWAENPEIHNPHKISKGQAIRFIGGTEANPPEVRVVEDTAPPATTDPGVLTKQMQAAYDAEDVIPAIKEAKEEDLVDIDVPVANGKSAPSRPNRALNQAPYYQEDIKGKLSQADLESGVVMEQSEIVPRPEIPPPTETRRKVLLDIPRSFREYRPVVYNKTVTINRRPNVAEKIPSAVVPGHMAFENLPHSVGMIEEVDRGELVASPGQNAFIRADEPLTIGSKVYSIVSRFTVKSSVSGRIGSAVEVGGVMRITELIDASTNLYKAETVYAVNPVRVGSLIIPGEPPRVPVSTKGRRLSAELVLAGGEDSDDRHFFDDGAVVYLDTMSSDVRVGDVLSMQARRGGRKQTVAPDQLTPIGILKVFAVTGKVASAFVVLATDEIKVGDRTGGVFPTRLPDLRVEAPKITTTE